MERIGSAGCCQQANIAALSMTSCCAALLCCCASSSTPAALAVVWVVHPGHAVLLPTPLAPTCLKVLRKLATAAPGCCPGITTSRATRHPWWHVRPTASGERAAWQLEACRSRVLCSIVLGVVQCCPAMPTLPCWCMLAAAMLVYAALPFPETQLLQRDYLAKRLSSKQGNYAHAGVCFLHAHAGVCRKVSLDSLYSMSSA